MIIPSLSEILPILFVNSSVNHRLPSGPDVMEFIYVPASGRSSPCVLAISGVVEDVVMELERGVVVVDVEVAEPVVVGASLFPQPDNNVPDNNITEIIIFILYFIFTSLFLYITNIHIKRYILL